MGKGINLAQKYTETEGRVFMSGTQVLVRLPMTQMRRDHIAGLNTAAYVTGYRGSPLGGLDQQLQKAQAFLDQHQVHFQPGINEDLAATAIWGTQQLKLSPGARYQGVVGYWYGKGPGVDRSGDVLKHGNAAGSSAHGGVLCFAGDDHSCKSSSIPHQSDHAFMSALMPVLYPSSIHEFLEMGLLGIAMSRYSGCWVGMKVISDTIETTAAIDLAAETRAFITPTDFEMPEGGLNLRWPDPPVVQDQRLQTYKGYAAVAFARANQVDKVTLETEDARFGIIASGKAYEDVRQALRELDIDEKTAHDLKLRLYKVRMPWPLEPEGVRSFSRGLEEILIIEERREMIENQIKQQLFNWRYDVRPRIIGKFDNEEKPFLSLSNALTVGVVARAIAERLLRFDLEPSLRQKLTEKLNYLASRVQHVDKHIAPISRLPYYCSGCPHNSSTKVPEGSRAAAGIGCHFMVQWMNRSTQTFTQMGGEGVSWSGVAPFTDEKHLFVNLGDGTYFHSGLLAIRQSVATGVNITYKILYNDAVAMTGGQTVDGELSAAQISFQLFHEKVSPIYFVTDNPNAYQKKQLAPGVILRHRDEMDAVMKEIRETQGCSAIIYEQTCAAEKRRRRKRGLMIDPAKRAFIHSTVCEGCGDCSDQSNCISIEPLETAMGRKRRINQSSCNKDYSCVKGFCPSFVTVKGGQLKQKAMKVRLPETDLPIPSIPSRFDEPYNIVITGVGGTGVLTIGALIGMAAHLEGKASMLLDMAGLAQKGGAVVSHVRLGNHPDEVASPRIVNGGADLIIAADAIVASSKDCIRLCCDSKTEAVVNSVISPVADFVQNRNFDFKHDQVLQAIKQNIRHDEHVMPYAKIAEEAIGDTIQTNIMMLGYAWQKGLVPLREDSIQQAIMLNNVAVEQNTEAFRWGRVLAVQPDLLFTHMKKQGEVKTLQSMSLDELIAHRQSHLLAYQDQQLVDRYTHWVERMKIRVDQNQLSENLIRAVAENYASVLAIKDEYEVARLYSNPEFKQQLTSQFEGEYQLEFHFSLPFLNANDSEGRPKKRTFGQWVLPMFKLLQRGKVLRGTRFDLFGQALERREERLWCREYEELIVEIISTVEKENQSMALALLNLPAQVKGFGPVKHQAIINARIKREAMLKQYHQIKPGDATHYEAA